MPKDNLNFGDHRHKSLLDVEDNPLGHAELLIINLELVKIVSVLDVFDALLNIPGVVYLYRFTFLNVKS